MAEVDSTLIAVAVAIAFALLLVILAGALAVQRFCGEDLDAPHVFDFDDKHRPVPSLGPEHSWVAEARALRERKARNELIEQERLLIADFPNPDGAGGYGLSRPSSGAGNEGEGGGYGLSRPSSSVSKVKQAVAEHEFAVVGADDEYHNIRGAAIDVVPAAAQGDPAGYERVGNSVRSAVRGMDDAAAFNDNAQRAGRASIRLTVGPRSSQSPVPGGQQAAYATASALEVEYTSVKDSAEELFQMSVPRTVVLSNGGAGFGLMCSESKIPRGGVFYCGARPGSVAANVPTLLIGSRILEVNRTSVITASLDDLAAVLRIASSAASLTLKILPPSAAQLLVGGPASRYRTHGTVADHRGAQPAASASASASDSAAIAASTALVPPPPPSPIWKPTKDTKGRTYYWNTITNAVSWVDPEAERRGGGSRPWVNPEAERRASRVGSDDALARQTMHEGDLVDFKPEVIATWSQDKTAGDGDDISLGLIAP